MLLNNNRENLVNPTRENLPTKKRSPIPGLSFERDPWQLCKKCICECFKTLRKHYVHKAEFCEDDPLYKHLLFEARGKNFSQTNYIPPLNIILMILFHRKYRTIWENYYTFYQTCRNPGMMDPTTPAEAVFADNFP